MMRLLIVNVLFSIIFLLSASVAAQGTAVADDTKQATQVPYEVIVTPTITRARLRSLVMEVEDDFWGKFNELNVDDYYDVQCYEYTPTMSHIKKRACEPNFYIMTRGDNASEVMFSLGGSTTNLSTATSIKAPGMVMSQPGLRKEVEEEFEILQEKMEELTRTDTEFRSIGNAFADIKERLENFGKD